MGDRSAIQWTDATWNPVAGCTRVSTGCDHCYAATLVAGRLRNTRQYQGLATYTPAGPAAFNGRIRLLPERLDQPLRWRQPRRVFVNSMSDLFHEKVLDDYVDQVFAVMALAPQHTFQVLTKRPQRMLAYFASFRENGATDRAMRACAWIDRLTEYTVDVGAKLRGIPNGLPNVWLGVSCEDQATADERIPVLLQTPAAVRFISAEPLLGPIDLERFLSPCSYYCDHDEDGNGHRSERGLDWIICGGESGPGHRPMDLAWARSLRDQCVGAGVPFFFKQWGGRTPKAGGRELDGRTWDQMPATAVRA